MTDQELIEYLKLQGLDKDIAAADRIEELVKETELLTKEVKLLEIGFDAAQAKLARAIDALREIAGRHIPSQPATDGGDEIDWCHRQYASLRGIARKVLAELGGKC